MRDEADFTSYAAARWQRVVCTLVLLGVPPGHASVLAGRAFTLCHQEWEHHDAFDELDAELYRIVLDCKEHDPTDWWEEPPFDDEVWAQVEPVLDRLSPLERTGLLLRHVAGLPELYVSAVLGSRRVGVSAPTPEELQEVARGVPVAPPDLEAMTRPAPDHPPRRSVRLPVVVGLAALVGVVVVALLVLLLG